MKANSIGCDCRKKKKGDGCELWFYLFEVNKPGFCTMLEVGSGSVDGGERSVLSWPDTGPMHRAAPGALFMHFAVLRVDETSVRTTKTYIFTHSLQFSLVRDYSNTGRQSRSP